MFKIGDYVVYKRDVCKIDEIREKQFMNKDYYVMRPIDDATLKLDVPIDSSDEYLRSVISKEEALLLIAKIPSIKTVVSMDRMIENEYKALLQSGSLEDLVCIIKTTYLRNYERKQSGKKIGEIDDTYFHRAEKILYNELSVSLGMNFDDTKEYVIASVLKACI